jgi:hypothetical protein
VFTAGLESWLARSGHLEGNPERSNMTTPRSARARNFRPPLLNRGSEGLLNA